MSEVSVFSANGKLMLFGEYVVMRGVPALAVPIRFGQKLEIRKSTEFLWQSYESDKLWFELTFDADFNVIETTDEKVAATLLAVLKELNHFDSSLFSEPLLFKMTANFNLNWGFGSSATFVSLLAQWSGYDAFRLNEQFFKGSGYDIACATAQQPLLYFMESRKVQQIEIPKPIREHLLFVYLGQKQNSLNEVKQFKSIDIKPNLLDELTQIVLQASEAKQIEEFEELIDRHEALLAGILDRPTLKSLSFEDYPYSVKSLGAWGGDFFMATCRNLDEARMYFIDKGKEVVFTYEMLV